MLRRLLEEMLREDEPPPDPAPIGVVFVHGIGSQAQSSTVREFAQPLLDYLQEWHRTRGAADWEPSRSDLSYGGTLIGPARVAAEIPAYTRGERTWPKRSFIFAEAWWAARLDPPSLNTMIGWSARTLVDVVWQLLKQVGHRTTFLFTRGGSSASDPGWFAALVEVASGLLFLVAYVIAALTGYMALLLLLILAQIPIKQVQEFILVTALKPFLVENLGDHETYMYDEVQALNTRAAVADAIRALLKMGCDEICIVAHSQGALVAFDGVCALEREDPVASAHVRKLITLGSALNRAFSQRRCPPRLRATLPKHVFWLDIWSTYDPVAGGYVRRPRGEPPMVQPTDAFRQRMGWTAAPGKTIFDGPLADQVTNSMNPLNDHGGYFHNPEQFANRVLAEIENPSDYYKHSRFYLPLDRVERVRRRRVRISTLAYWRLVAIGSVAVALVLRGGARLKRDAEHVLEALATQPAVKDLVTAPGKTFDALGALLDRLGAELSAIAGGLMAARIADLRTWWRQVPWSDQLLASLLYAALFAALYWVLLRLLYLSWDERERREAVAEEVPVTRAGGLLVLARSFGVVLAFGDALLAVWSP